MAPGIVVGADALANANMALLSSTALTASTHKLTMVGVVQKSGTISSVSFRLGSVTKGATTELLVSLQDVDTANGPPGRPDGTVDQSGTISNANIVSNTYVTATLGTNRTVTVGDLLAVVIEFSTFNASDSVPISTFQVVSQSGVHALIGLSHYNGTTWSALATGVPIVGLGYTDGTVNSLLCGLPLTSVTTNSFNSGSSPNDRGIRWVPTATQVVLGLWAMTIPSGDYDLVLYDSGGTALGTASLDANTARAASLRPTQRLFASPVTVSAGSTYYLTIRPSTTTNISAYTFGLNAAADREAWPLGTEADGATRTGTGAWTISSTSRVPVLPIIDFAATVALPVVRVI